jgi:hypothetical protein
VVAARGKDRIGDSKKITLNPGEPVCILSRVPLTRFNLYAFVDAIAGRNVETSNRLSAGTACISRGFSSMPGGTLNELLAIPAGASPDTVAALYRQVGLENESGRMDGDALLTDADWKTFSRQTRACILMQQAKDEAACLVLADAAVLAKCSAAYLEQWYGTISSKITGIVADDLQMIGGCNCASVVLLASDRSVSVAAASWCLDNAAVIDAWFDRHSVQIEAELDDDVFDEE